MDQRVRTETGPPPGVPERRGRRGTAAVAPDRIPFQRPQLPAAGAIMAHFQRSVDEEYFATGGPCARELTVPIEQRLAHRAHCVLVSSATTGLMAALRAVCGAPKPRRRLIACPSYSFTATAGAIAWAGLDPLFIDIEPEAIAARSISLPLAQPPARHRGVAHRRHRTGRKGHERLVSRTIASILEDRYVNVEFSPVEAVA